MEQLVTIEILKKSQRTRPRIWIPVFQAIMLLITLAVGLFETALLLPTLPFREAILALFGDSTIALGTLTGWGDVLAFFILPVALVVINLVNIIVDVKICMYRRTYWWFGAILLILYIAVFLYTGFWMLYYFVEFFRNLIVALEPYIPMMAMINSYSIMGYTAAFVLFQIFCLFYNVNYPGKYEEIYTLRKERIKSYHTSDERIAYKKRFYDDYKRGNWISMMLDLHYKSLLPGSTAPMRKDAYEFMVYYAAICDADIKRAIFDEYAAQGRYLECRTLYNDVKAKGESARNGIRVILPHYQERKPRKAKARKVEGMPPLPEGKPKPNVRTKHYSPDEIG